MTLVEIKEEVPKLTFEEQMELMAMLHSLTGDDDDDEFDAAIRADMKNHGPLYQMGEKAREEFRRGETLPGWP